MGIRSKIKGRLKKIVGGGGGDDAVDKGSPAGWMPSTAATPEFDKPAPAPAPAAPKSQAAPKQETAPAPKLQPAAKLQAAGAVLGPHDGPDVDKERMARLKAKKAVLQQLSKVGGEAPMKELHDFSERRYFVAHKAFSDLMEEFTAQGLIDFDGGTYQCVITPRGREWVDAAGHVKTREK